MPSSLPRRSRRLRSTSSPARAEADSDEGEVQVLPSSPPQLSDLGSPEASDDEDIVMVTKAKPRRKSRYDNDDLFIVNNDEIRNESDGEVQIKQPSRRKARLRGGDDFVVEDDEVEYLSSSDEPAPAVERSPGEKLQSSGRKSRRKARRRTREEQDELDEDLLDLRDTDQGEDEDEPVSTMRTRGGPVTTQRDNIRKHLEVLKRRRAGLKPIRVLDSDDEQEQAEDDEPEAADIGYIGRPVQIGAEVVSSSSEDEGTRPGQQEVVEDDEDDFIEEDDSDNRLGRPQSGIPLEFTHFATKRPKDLFLYIVEWLVKNKIAPAFDRSDPVYELAFRRVDDQVRAQAGSRLISAAWSAEFKNAILARPDMKVEALPGDDEEHIRTCDACNRLNNPARYQFSLSGTPYHQKSLEPVDPESDNDEEESGSDESQHGGEEYNDAGKAARNDTDNSTKTEDDDPEDKASVTGNTYDESGHLLPSSHRKFYLGRFCAANAEMGHKLTHWKYHLNASLISYLYSQRVLSAEAIVSRDSLNARKREKEAEAIVEEMEETGVIAEFWREFMNNLDDARLGMEDFEKKGGRSKGRIGAVRVQKGPVYTEYDKDKVRVRRDVRASSGEAEGW
jgi:hypothetical protein